MVEEVHSPAPAAAASPAASGGAAAPYRNLWVPLLVVPFLVVGVLVLVYVFFGAIRGREASIQENLERVIQGGANERKQAALSLAAQVAENRRAVAEGREPVWGVRGDLLGELRRAWDALPSDDNPHIRLALAQLAAGYGDPDSLAKLSGFLALPESEDPRGELRAQAMVGLSWLGDPRAADSLAPFLNHPDPFLRQAAAAALQRVPGNRSLEALRGLLADPSLELRGQAAISLSCLGDPAGAAVLLELLRPESYAQVRAEDPRKFKSAGQVHETRLEALRALARLARPEDRPVIESLAAGDLDPTIREAAMLVLQATPPGGSGEGGR